MLGILLHEGLEQLPIRIEGFDVSNLGAEHTVASMVVFEGGTPKKAHYRKFKVRGAGPDDVSSISEVLERRMARYVYQADLSPHDAELSPYGFHVIKRIK